MLLRLTDISKEKNIVLIINHDVSLFNIKQNEKINPKVKYTSKDSSIKH